MIERRDIPVEKLTVDVVQSREEAWAGDERDQRLAESVATNGLLQDLIVRPVGTISHVSTDGSGTVTQAQASGGTPGVAEFAIVAGSRRYHAAMEAGYETVPCKIVDVDDLDAACRSLSENTDRRDLSEQEIAQQLNLIFELVRPLEEPTGCPSCGQSVDGERALHSHCQETCCELPGDPKAGPPGLDCEEANGDGASARFPTEKQAVTYVAYQHLGRVDDVACDTVRGHLRTAQLPPLLQSLFKQPSERTRQERTTLANYGFDAQATLGSGEGRSHLSREVAILYDTLEADAETEELQPTEGVLEAVGALQFEEMSDQEFRKTLREFRTDVSAELESAAAETAQDQRFRETLHGHVSELKELYEGVEPVRPFKKVDVLGPETQRHSRLHARAMQHRDESGHGELVRTLYLEQLEQLAESEGWE